MILSMAMIVVQSLTNSFGEQFIAANVIVMRVDGFAMMPNFSFGTTMTTYAGQNVGARKYDRVYQGARQGTLIAMATSATITGLILIFGRQLMGIFYGHSFTGRFEPPDDGHSGCRLYRHGGDTESLRCHERRR